MRLELILSSVAAVVSAQGVTQYLAPKGKSPIGCEINKPGKYELSVAPMVKKQKRMAFEVGTTLQVTLQDGVLTDATARTGYIADNYQFQFDGPPQAGSIFTGGWSLCSNGSLALGPSTVFYQCLSGSFYNLYDRWWAQQCSPIQIVAHALSPDAAAAPAAPLGGPILTATADPIQSGSPDLPPVSGSPSSPAKATSDTVGGMASVTLSSGAAVETATPGLSASASSLSSLDSSISSASSIASSLSSSISSSASSSLSSASASIRSSASSSRTSSSARPSASANNGVHVGGTGASTIALLMGVVGMVLA